MFTMLATIIVMAIFLAMGGVTVAFFAKWAGMAFHSLGHNA